VSYRPQSAYPDPPEGWKEEDFVYYFDQTNCPALALIPYNQPISRIVLQLEHDAPFKLRAIQISGNAASMFMRLYDPYDNPLSQVLVEADRAYAGNENGPAPIGRLPVVLEPEIPCPAGGYLQVDLELI
jgi:hypothetical protein